MRKDWPVNRHPDLAQYFWRFVEFRLIPFAVQISLSYGRVSARGMQLLAEPRP